MNLYLSSDEILDFKEVREVSSYSNLIIENKRFISAKIFPPLIGQKYGWGEANIDQLYLINRFEGDEGVLEKLNKFPIYLLIMIAETPDKIPDSLSELQNIAWACLYDSKFDAERHSF